MLKSGGFVIDVDSRSNPFNRNDNKKYITDPVFLIGNGTSREDFDLERLRPFGTIIGCNALFREFSPDILLLIDAKMIREVKDANYVTEDTFCIIPVGRTIAIKNAIKWRTAKFNTAGCFGMHLISRLIRPKTCYMLGMDNYAGNIYDNTQNYGCNTLQNFAGVGKYYIQALKGKGDTKFINVNIKDSWPKEAEETDKYKFITYEQFEEIIQDEYKHRGPLAE